SKAEPADLQSAPFDRSGTPPTKPARIAISVPRVNAQSEEPRIAIMAVTREEGAQMPCCHADFAAVEGSDRGFTVGMPTFTFGSGVLAEAGEHARELGLSRVALFTDPQLASGEYVRTVRASLNSAGVESTFP